MSDDISIPRPGFAAPHRLRGLEPGTKRLIWIASGLVVGLAGIVGVASLVGGGHTAETPVVQADSRPVRVKPENPGGLQVAGLNNEIFSGGSDTGGSKLAPPPETPNPKALQAPPAPAPPVVLSAPVVAAPIGAAPIISQSGVAQSGVALNPPGPPISAKPAAPPPVAKPVAGKGPSVQLAALGSETSAHNEWQALTKKMPDILSGRQPTFSKVERDGKTYWRVRTGGFADVAAAKTFCERVRTKGGGCTVADF